MKKIIFLTALTIVLTGCDGAPKAIPKWSEGMKVRSVLSNQEGQITDTYCSSNKCSYDVRFVSSALVTDTHLLSSDGVIMNKPFVEVYMHEYELKGE